MPAQKNSRELWPPVVIAMAGIAAYANSLSGPFVFDDLGSITDNPTIRHLWPIWPVLHAPASSTTGGRPVMNLSYAVNYALGGVDVWGYHALNLLIHILAGLTLFGIMRRTLERWGGLSPRRPFGSELEKTRTSFPMRRLRDKPPHLNTTLAFAVALIWTVHPLQTEAVTYISERAESLMGLFYFLTLYFFIRSTGSDLQVSSFKFQILSVAASLFGVATKEVLLTVPVVVLLYDRTFVSGTFGEAWRRHWRYYAGLAGAWLLSGYLMSDLRQRVAGLDLAGNWFGYALMESRVILKYLGLAVWPHPLVFDYGSGIGPPTWSVAPCVAVVLLLLGATLWLLFAKIQSSKFEIRNLRAFGYAGAWFFITLAPTSSIVPLAAQPMAEHRMYLPLAAVIAVLVLGIHALLGRLGKFRISKFGFRILIVVALACIFLTARRNEVYRSAEALWGDTVAKRPDNARAHYGLGNARFVAGRTADAIAQYEEAIRLKPDDPEVYANLGIALNAAGRAPEAIAAYEEALRLRPDDAQAHNNLGSEFQAMPDRLGDAIAQYETALRLKPEYAEAHYNLGNALNAEGRTTEAFNEYAEALRLRPDHAEAHYSLGNALIAAGRGPDAIAQYEEAVRLKPDYAEAHNNLGNALNAEGRAQEAIVQYEEALRLRPDAAVHLNLASALLKIPGRTDDAVAHLEAALRLQPDNEAARQLLDRIRALQP